MKIFITGSQGLIGSALKRKLNLLGIEVVGIDIKCSKDSDEKGDILDFSALRAKAEDVDGIVHLAAVSRVIDGEKAPKLCWNTNVQGTENVTRAAKASSKKPWIIYSSSREVYGEPDALPVKEWFPLKPVNIYGESKAEAENIMQLAQKSGIQTAILRLSNVYGSVHDYPDRVIPAFCKAAAEGKAIRVDGKDNSFDFTYIEDVTAAILSLVRLISSIDTSIEPIHLTTGVETSLGVASSIAKQASTAPLEIIEKPSRSFDVAHFCGDPLRAKEVLNWKASILIEEGMRRLINEFRLKSQAVQASEAALHAAF